MAQICDLQELQPAFGLYVFSAVQASGLPRCLSGVEPVQLAIYPGESPMRVDPHGRLTGIYQVSHLDLTVKRLQ